jgi:hypothetical protein
MMKYRNYHAECPIIEDINKSGPMAVIGLDISEVPLPVQFQILEY